MGWFCPGQSDSGAQSPIPREAQRDSARHHVSQARRELWGSFWMRGTFESVGQAEQMPFPVWAGFIQSIQGPVKTKSLTLLLIRGNSCLTVLSWDRRFSCLQNQSEISVLLDLESGSLWTATPSALLGLQLADYRGCGMTAFRIVWTNSL